MRLPSSGIRIVKQILTALLLWAALGPTAAWAEAVESPDAIIQQTSEQMLDALRQNYQTLKQDPRQVYGLVNHIVLPKFDFEAMSRWVLGRYWREATPEQRERFVNEFRTLLVRTYASSLLDYTSAQIRILPMAPVTGDDATVRSQVERSNGQPIPINYSMHLNEDGTWKVYDVTVDGVSLVTTYRSSFASEIRQDGIDGLIAKLAEHNARGSSS